MMNLLAWVEDGPMDSLCDAKERLNAIRHAISRRETGNLLISPISGPWWGFITPQSKDYEENNLTGYPESFKKSA